MNFKLSCYCCGSTEFKVKDSHYVEIEKVSYLLAEDANKDMFTCSKCGLEDYTMNMVIRCEVVS